MKSKAGRLFMVLGSLLIISSFALLIYNRQEAERAGENSAAFLAKVQAAAEENMKLSRPEADSEFPVLPKRNAPLVSVEIDGYGYIGYLSIPELELELPVMDTWDYDRLRIAPCRQYGETVGKMIIAGHNYARHFGSLRSLTGGEAVYFTDMSGETTEYVVDDVSIVGPDGLNSLEECEWNLVLYTCTYGGRNRVMVRCSENSELQGGA